MPAPVSDLLPRVKKAPGLVAGYWMNAGGGHGYTILMFDSEEKANNAKQMAEGAPRPDFVKLNTAQVYEVIASV